MAISKHTRNGVVRPRCNIKHGCVPSVKRSIANVLTSQIRLGVIPFSTKVIREKLKDGF